MKPDFAIMGARNKGRMKILTIDTNKAIYQSIPWRTLGDFGKRKFENLLVLTNSPTRVVPLYV